MIRLITDNKRIIELIDYETLNPDSDFNPKAEVEVIADETIEVAGLKLRSDDSVGILEAIKSLQGKPKAQRFIDIIAEVTVNGILGPQIVSDRYRFYTANSGDMENWEEHLLVPGSERRLVGSVDEARSYWNISCLIESEIDEAIADIEFYHDNLHKSKDELLHELAILYKQVEELEDENIMLHEYSMDDDYDYYCGCGCDCC